MKNYEKYADEIREYKGDCFCVDFVKPNILKKDSCAGIDCEHCRMLQAMWLLEDYEEPEVDWSKVEVDTPILVKEYEESKWTKRYFARYEDGVVYAWNNGVTSWTANDDECVISWSFSKLAETEGAE